MAKVLTQAAIDAIKPGDKRREIPDGRTPGLYLIVQPSDARSWAYRYRVDGRARKVTLGQFPALGLASARARAAKAKARLADGIDPGVEKRAAKVAAETPLDLVSSVAEAFIERHAKRTTRPRSWKETQRILMREVVPIWGRRRLSTITRADTHALLDPIADRAPILANRVLGVLKTMGRWARDRGVVETSPFAELREPAPAKARERALDEREIRALWAALDAEPYPIGPLTRVLLLTAARRSEVGEMRWSELDLDAKVWRLPGERSKNHRAHELPLSDAIVDILQQLPRIEASDFVFTTNGVRPATSFGGAKRRVHQRMEATLGESVPSWSYHDLRRSAASHMASLGIGPHVVEAILNHKSGVIRGVAAIYNKYQYQPEQRAALEAWSRRVREIASGEKAASNVIEFTKEKA